VGRSCCGDAYVREREKLTEVDERVAMAWIALILRLKFWYNKQKKDFSRLIQQYVFLFNVKQVDVKKWYDLKSTMRLKSLLAVASSKIRFFSQKLKLIFTYKVYICLVL
jgi:hypothetical protein